jgi:hypothetical protein
MLVALPYKGVVAQEAGSLAYLYTFDDQCWRYCENAKTTLENFFKRRPKLRQLLYNRRLLLQALFDFRPAYPGKPRSLDHHEPMRNLGQYMSGNESD